MTSPDPRRSVPTAAQRLRLFQQRWPAAAYLARLLSLAVRIEPHLLRAARLAAGLDAATEADLWFSGIITSSGTLGISFVPAVAEALRRELAASPEERALAWSLVQKHHGQQPWSIRLEERINYLTTGPPTEASEIEDLLAAALSELREVRARDEQAALGIARWLLAALARAPAAARATPTAAAAELAAGVHLDGRLGGADQLARAENSELLPWLLEHLGTMVLPVRLLSGAVALGGDPPDGIPLPVPVTDPLVVSVIWDSGYGTRHEHVRVAPGEELLVPIEATEVELRTLAGGGVVLRRADIGRILVNGIDQGAGFAVADYAILTAAHVLGDWALHLGPPNDPSGSFSSEAPAPEAESMEDADDGLSGSGPVPDVVYVPEDGEPMSARVIARDTELDVVLLEPGHPVPAIMPVGQIQPGQQWRLQTLPEHNPANSRQTVDVPAAIIRGVTSAGDTRPQFVPRESTDGLRGQSGAAIILENPWGAVIGLLLAEQAEMDGPPADVRQRQLADVLQDEQLADVLEEMPEEDQVRLLAALGPEGGADVVEEMTPDDAADLLAEIPPEQRERLLAAMETVQATDLRSLLSQRYLRVAPIDAIVASFNLARQITPATAALVDGKWPETQRVQGTVTWSDSHPVAQVPAGDALAIVSPDRFLLHWKTGDDQWQDAGAGPAPEEVYTAAPGDVYAVVLGPGQLTGTDLTFTRRYLDRVTAGDPASGWEARDHVVQLGSVTWSDSHPVATWSDSHPVAQVPAGDALAIVSPDRFLLRWKIGDDQPWYDDMAVPAPGDVYAVVLGARQLTSGDLTFTRRYLDRVTAGDPASGWEGQEHVVQLRSVTWSDSHPVAQVPAGNGLAIVSPDRFLLHWKTGDQSWRDDRAVPAPGDVYAVVLGAGQLTGTDLTFVRCFLDRVTAGDPASGWEAQDHVVQLPPAQAQN